MRNIVLTALCLALLTVVGRAQYLQAVTIDGSAHYIGIEEVRFVKDNPSGGSIIRYKQGLDQYFVAETMETLVTNSCGRLFMANDSENPDNPRIAFNKDFVDRIIEDANEKALVMLDDIGRRYTLTEDFDDMAYVLSCSNSEEDIEFLFRLSDESNVIDVNKTDTVVHRGGSLISISVYNENSKDIVETYIDASQASYGEFIGFDENGVGWKTVSFGDGDHRNGLTEVDSVAELGGTLIHNTLIDQDDYDMIWSGGGKFEVENGSSDRILSDTDVRLQGSGGSYVALDNVDFNLDALGGQTFWAYGAELFPVGRFLQLIDPATREIRYGSWSLPIDAPGPDEFLITDGSGNVIWSDTLEGFGDNWGTQVVVSDGTLSGDGTVEDPLSVDVESFGDNWGTQVAITDGVTITGNGTVESPLVGNALGDDWGSGSFSFRGTSGSTQEVQDDDVVLFNGIDVIGTVSSTDQLDIFVVPGTEGSVLKTTGGNVVWGSVSGDDWGSGSFILTGDTGSPQTVNEGETLDINGTGVIETATKSSDGIDVYISSSNPHDILVYDSGGDVVKYTIPECDSAVTGAICYKICEGEKELRIKS